MSVPKLTGCRCQCCACGEYFGSVDVFDRHRVGEYGVNRRCLSVDEMSAMGWERNGRGFWLRHRLGAGRVASFGSSHDAPATAPQGVLP